MTTLDQKIVDTSVLIEKQLPSFVRESNQKFISFLTSYYESQEVKYNSLDIVENLIDYYNIGYYTPSKLVEYTTVMSLVSADATTITVLSTIGFPESNGYIQIGDEIIFYKSKTKTQFVDCVRATGAFVLDKIPTSEVVYKKSKEASSYIPETKVYNISYQFVTEFFDRIKSEISPTLPETLAPELNISSFLKNISSFYRAKGTENSHKLLFRILFNERRVKLKLKSSGTGAVIDILNYSGDISSFQISSAGSGYYYELPTNGGPLVAPPVIDIIGSGTGAVNPVTSIASKRAEMVVTGMNSSGGITAVQVANKGSGYIGPITARVRERIFDQDQIVNCLDSNNNVIGRGKVYSWSDSSRELILYEITGYFKANSKLIGVGGESPRSIISAAYPVTTLNKEGNPSIEIIPNEVRVERPKENVIRPSSSSFYERRIVRCELISGAQNLDNVKLLELVQSRDLSYEIPGVVLEITEIQKLQDNLYEFEIGDNLKYNKLFLPPSTVVTQTSTLTSNTLATVTTTNAKNFPTRNGKLYINGRIVEYQSRNDTQFLSCRIISGTSPLVVQNKDNAYLYGRTCITSGSVNYFLNGYINGDRSLTPIVFKIIGVPSEIKISNGGALYSSSLFKFATDTTDSILTGKLYNFGSVDQIIIENVGQGYKVNDRVIVNNEFTSGSGFSAYVSEISGVNISSYQFVTQLDQQLIKITTTQNHNLAQNDVVLFANSQIGRKKVFSVDSSTQFSIPCPVGFVTQNLTLTYTTTSRGASGSIVKILISNKGNNYKKLPEVVGVQSENGYGALLQLNSSTIGRLSSIRCESIYGELIGDRKAQFNVKFPSTAKLKNNYQIARIDVISGGNNYRPTDKVKVNGVVDNNYQFKIITSSGVITAIEVIYGGNNLNAIPTITIQSDYGTGAQLEAKLARKLLFENDTLNFGSYSSPTGTAKVINFDAQTSTLEFELVSGAINENDTIYFANNVVYGQIFSIKSASAYATTSPYVSFPFKFLDNYGFLNDSSQRIHDSDYYQDWSYTIASTKNTLEWRNEVIANTHPSGFKLFGKNLIENQKPLFKSQQDVFNSSVIFKATLSNLLNLNIKLSDCKTQKVLIENYAAYAVGDFVYGNISGATGIVKDISESYIEILLLGTSSFVVGEYIFEVSRDFAAFGNHESNTLFTFYSGILQKPVDSYYVSNNNFIPRFPLNAVDEIVANKLTNEFSVLDFQVVGNTLKLFKNGAAFNPGSAEKLLISVNGVVQNPTYTLSGNIVTLSTALSTSDTIFVLYQQNLRVLTLSGSGTNYTINYTPSSSCNLLLFANSVYQSQLLTDFSIVGNQVSLSESVNSSSIFGWYIDETVTCYLLNVSTLSANKILDVNNCEVKKLTQYIESNVVKTPESLYQITKDLLDGTVYADPDNTTVYGFDSRFTYTNPEYSSSYVEVLNEITFNGSTTTFNLRYTDGLPYAPVNGKNTLLVYVNNQVVDQDQYTISGSTITFNQAYSASAKCTIIDFNSKYLANNTSSKSANLDRLNVVQNGTRKTFNLSDKGVPQYVKNVGDLFVIKNGNLRRPETQEHSISSNKITFVTAPTTNDNIKLCYFNRQLEPEKTKNVILDSFICFNGVRATFPISLDGILFAPITEHHLFVVRNSVYQKPTIDYTISGTNITFTTAPLYGEEVSVYYSYDGLTQNFKFDDLRMYTGSQSTFSLTKNYISTTVYSASHLQVVRNGVYQYPGIDYSVGGVSDSRYINFVTAPTNSDDISIVNYKSEDLVDVTNRFTQINTTSLQYTSQAPAIDTSVFLIYVNGILQVGNSWSFNTTTNVLTFQGFVSLSLDKVQVLAFKTAKRILDPITIVSGTTTYNLQVNNSTITTSLPTNSSDLLVSVNGVQQLPISAYTVSGSTITFIDSNLPVGGSVYIYQIGSSTFDTEVIDYINDNYAKSTYKLQVNYKSFNPPASSDIFVLRNGVLQNPGEDFIAGNGYITFTTNITGADDVYLGYRHGTTEIAINSVSGTTVTLATSIPSSQYKDLVLHINGVPQFYGTNFTISGNVVTLSSSVQIDSIFAIKYVPITFIDPIEDCPNSIRTKFRLFYNAQNLIIANILQDADILVSVNGIIQYPGVQYTISPNRGIIEFLTPPQFTDQIFMVRMSGNEVVNLTSVSGSNTVYNLSQSIPTQRQENLVVFSNNAWKFNELGEYTYNTTSRITLAAANTSTYVFGIKFAGIFHLLDQINTPYNGSNIKFNLFLNQENFMPPGTIENDVIPSESSLVVVKNGKILDPGVEYTLQGDIKSQIQFSVAPISTDVISVKCVGSFLKLLSITSGFGGKTYSLKKQDNTAYYPNAGINRPRSYENQILVIKDGNIQSPLYDYYVDNDKLIFNNNLTASKLVILDFRGTKSDVNIDSVSYQVNAGDRIKIDGEQNERIVSEVISPTVLKTISYAGSKPSGFTGTATTSSGKLTAITVTNGGKGYKYPVVLRTSGSGHGAKATASVNNTLGGAIQAPILIQYPGYNQYVTQNVIPTSYAYAQKRTQLSTSNVKIGTKLTANINSTTEVIPLANAQNFEQSDAVVNITSSTGSGATFRAFISNGRVRKVEVLTPGIGYDDRDAEITITGGGGSGCVLETILDSMGRVTSVVVRNSGEGYDVFRVIIDRDIIEYTNIVSNQLVGCTRLPSSLAHNQDDIVYYDKFI
jgi:hypothetical protein